MLFISVSLHIAQTLACIYTPSEMSLFSEKGLAGSYLSRGEVIEKMVYCKSQIFYKVGNG